MNLRGKKVIDIGGGIPRVSGGEPNVSVASNYVPEYSPRERG